MYRQKLDSYCVVCQAVHNNKRVFSCQVHGVCKQCSKEAKDMNCHLCGSTQSSKPAEFCSPSSKLKALKDLLATLTSEGRTKIIIFSQWTSMIELMARQLGPTYKYTSLTGQMSSEERVANINAFKTDGSVSLFLISITAGGLGLNLCVSSTVILMEPHYNPCVEKQAMDRVHRIGQTQPVRVYRLVTQDTIESRVISIQKKKQTLARNLLGTEAVVDGRLSSMDIKFLAQ